MMRTIKGIVMVAIALMVLIACGADETANEKATREAGETSPTDVPTEVVQIVATDAAEDAATARATTAANSATQEAQITPTSAPTVAATTSPWAQASPVGSPMATPVAAGTQTDTLRELVGTVTLRGTENVDYVVTDEGCQGIGQYARLHPGTQVVIRNENGTIVSVAALDRTTSGDGCEWNFVAQVPEARYYEVTIPMVSVNVFTLEQVQRENGTVEIVLP